MAAQRSKSKKQSAGKDQSPSPPEDFTLFLDENLCNSTAICDVLKKFEVPFQRHLDHFSRGVSDETWLPLLGNKNWVLLTADKRIRYNLLEKQALKENFVREFVFSSGNLSGQDMAEALQSALPKMRRLCRRVSPPFVAAITKAGEVHIRWPK
jgi:hypothetical protein